jgi:osmotically-inducible protein OsmY
LYELNDKSYELLERHENMEANNLMKPWEFTGKKYGWMLVLFLGLFLAFFSATAMAQNPEDIDITNHLETEFWTDNEIPSNSIDVATNNGIVTLKGSVDNILAKERAQKITESHVGVKSVVNLITVKPLAHRSDNDITKAVKDALMYDAATDSYDVKVNVKAGVVELAGAVDSWQEKDLCTIVADDVKGVVKVMNNIDVLDATKRADPAIEQEIKDRLANDNRVDDALINVSVKDGKVVLTGTVGSLQEKNKAETDAWVAGVKSVNKDGLGIKWRARNEMRRNNLYASRTDEEIQKAITNVFLYDPRTYGSEVIVDVNHATVTLRGVVDNLEAKISIETDAQNIIGVRRVINNIKVRPQKMPTDDELQNMVNKTLLNDPYMERFSLTISAHGGTVYLSGTVNTSWEKERAESIAEGIKGVVYVVNNVVDEHKWIWKQDSLIKEDVEAQLQFDPFVDSTQITVNVENGIVTLTGGVEIAGDRQHAEDDAFNGGAKEVKDKLAVTLWPLERIAQ